jgi:hypothetical protein
LSVGNNNPYYPARFKNPMALAEKVRNLLAIIQMFHKVFGEDALRRAVGKG